MESQLSLAEIVVKDISGLSLSIEEQLTIGAWTNEKPGRARMLTHFRSQQWRLEKWREYQHQNKKALWANLQARIAANPDVPPLPDLINPDWGETQGAEKAGVRLGLFFRVRKAIVISGSTIAATLLLAIGIRDWNHFRNQRPPPEGHETAALHLPAVHEAILALNENPGIILGSHSQGVLAKEDGMEIYEQQDGVVAFIRTSPDKNAIAEGTPVSVSTQPGGHYDLAMPEGS